MNENQCNCTPQNARCPIGIELDGKIMDAHIAIERAAPEKKIAMYQAFTDAVVAYQKHVALREKSLVRSNHD